MNIFPHQEYHETKFDRLKKEWYCSECGRRIKFIGRRKIVIEKGNEEAVHDGGIVKRLEYDSRYEYQIAPLDN